MINQEPISISIIGMAKTNKPQVMPIKYLGLCYYPALPEGMRQANTDDFFSNQAPRIGMNFLVKAWGSDEYEAHKVNCDFAERWGEYAAAGRLYIQK